MDDEISEEAVPDLYRISRMGVVKRCLEAHLNSEQVNEGLNLMNITIPDRRTPLLICFNTAVNLTLHPFIEGDCLE
uniref:Uncharacterized protein n=1 Tax=Arion vulgaris TaxID=1028688 RepID=A0A0B7BW29_9EUPU